VFLNQRAAEFSFFTPSAPHRPIHSNLSSTDRQHGVNSPEWALILRRGWKASTWKKSKGASA
jgi:hypothetical protein